MVKAEVYGPSNYNSCANRVKKLTGVLLIFHPGCGHCVQMKPEWEAMKETLSPSTRVMEVDGSEMAGNAEMSRSIVTQRLQGFPTILRLKNGKVAEEFRGQRVANEMKQFAERGSNSSMGVGKKRKQKTRKSKKRKQKTRKQK
jgi:hypothetical protein